VEGERRREAGAVDDGEDSSEEEKGKRRGRCAWTISWSGKGEGDFRKKDTRTPKSSRREYMIFRIEILQDCRTHILMYI
jgi:hypothetical protein